MSLQGNSFALCPKKHEFLMVCEPHTRNVMHPVRKAGYIDKTQVTENMVFAGETALSEKTMLNPSRVFTYAISEKDYDSIKMLFTISSSIRILGIEILVSLFTHNLL